MDTCENGGHTEEWLETTNFLMQTINYFLKTIPMLHSQRHYLCAVALGSNYCDNFVDSIIVIYIERETDRQTDRERERKKEKIKSV